MTKYEVTLPLALSLVIVAASPEEAQELARQNVARALEIGGVNVNWLLVSPKAEEA